MTEDTHLLTPEQVAKRLNVSRVTVMKWLRQGRIPGRKLGEKLWRVHPDDLQAFIDASAVSRPGHEG
jgi:excisionase family DNA binding protein